MRRREPVRDQKEIGHREHGRHLRARIDQQPNICFPFGSHLSLLPLIMSISPMGISQTDAYCPVIAKLNSKEKGQAMSKRAIVVVDLQNDYFSGGKYELVGIDKAAENAARVIEAAR